MQRKVALLAACLMFVLVSPALSWLADHEGFFVSAGGVYSRIQYKFLANPLIIESQPSEILNDWGIKLQGGLVSEGSGLNVTMVDSDILIGLMYFYEDAEFPSSYFSLFVGRSKRLYDSSSHYPSEGDKGNRNANWNFGFGLAFEVIPKFSVEVIGRYGELSRQSESKVLGKTRSYSVFLTANFLLY